MYLLHTVFPNEPEERAQGPLSLGPQLAKDALEGGTVAQHVIKGPEGDKGEPDGGRP